MISLITPADIKTAGGAYLEEAVREAVFAELAAQVLPHGGVPTLAIIDLGLVQDWQTDWSPRKERRVVMVRPAFLRPAHFERAVGFVTPDGHAARHDTARVAAMFAALQSACEPGELPALFERLWRRWAAQLAHGFIHQFSHGNDTSSNIALDGRLVDFGAATFVPSWARVASTRHPVGLAERVDALTEAQRSLAWHLGRHVTPGLAYTAHLQGQVLRVQRQVHQSLCDALLQRLGLTALAGAAYAPGTPALSRLTDATRPPSPVEVDARQALCFPELKRRLFAELDASERDGPPPTRVAVSAVITRHVALGLRSLGRPPAALPPAVRAAARSPAH